MKQVNLRDVSVLMVILSAIAVAFMPNGIYLALGFAVLQVVLTLTWKQHMPNVFTFIMVFHWVQVFTFILFVNSAWNGDLNLLTESSAKAYLCAFTGIIIMSFVFNKIAFKNVHITLTDFNAAIDKINPKKVLYLYLILYLVSTVLSRVAFGFGGLAQLFFNIALLKWAGFVMLGYLSFRKKEYLIFFIIAFVLDFIGGFFSFFSSFKEVFYYTGIVLMTYLAKVSFKVSVKGIAIGLSLFFLGVVWTIVKGDYRNFLNEGTNQQTVVVSQNEAFNKLTDLLSGVSKETINEGIGQFLFRLQYIYHLAKAMDYVPATEPFQKGAVWKQSIEFTVVPRMFNPDKGILDASVKTSKFTGIQYLKGDQGVSFSLGYFADSYVDFGIPGMFVALAVLAFIWSKVYRFFLLQATGNIVINYSIVAAIFVQFALFETDGTILFGRIFTTFIVFLLFKYTLFKQLEKFVSF